MPEGLIPISSVKAVSTTPAANLSVGYFIHKRFEIGTSINIRLAKEGFLFKSTLVPFINIYFPITGESRIVPYLGGRLGYPYAGGYYEWIYGYHLGTKLFVSKGGGAAFAQVQFLRHLQHPFISLLAGLSLFL